VSVGVWVYVWECMWECECECMWECECGTNVIGTADCELLISDAK
jgi:hypothetical protein